MNSQTQISRHFLKMYKVDYTDPNNFIYKANNKNIDDYKDNNVWKSFEISHAF